MIFPDDYRMLALVSCLVEEQELSIGQSSVTASNETIANNASRMGGGSTYIV